MNRQFADQAAHRLGAQIDVGQGWIAANRQWRGVCGRKAEAGLG